MVRRLLGALIAATALAAASPGSASAFVAVAFTVGPGPTARVDAVDFEAETPPPLKLVRDGAVIASSATGFAEVAELRAGDTVRVSPEGTTNVVTVTYDGTPKLGEICIGRSTFTVTRPTEGQFEVAAGFLSEDPEAPTVGVTVGDGSPAVVSLARPLAAGEGAYAQSVKFGEDLLVGTAHVAEAKNCNAGRQPGRDPDDKHPDPDRPRGGSTGPARLSATLAAARLKRIGLARLARARTHTLPVAFSQPGTIRLKLLSRGKVIGAGTKTAAARERRVTIKLTAAGRRLLQGAKRLKVTLKGTFTPSRAGEVPQRASVSVTLRR